MGQHRGLGFLGLGDGEHRTAMRHEAVIVSLAIGSLRHEIRVKPLTLKPLGMKPAIPKKPYTLTPKPLGFRV